MVDVNINYDVDSNKKLWHPYSMNHWASFGLDTLPSIYVNT